MMVMWTRIYALLIKEFLALFKDKKSRFVLIGPPIIELLVFGYAATYDLNRIPIAVYNEDTSIASRELVASFTGSPTFSEVLRITRHEQIKPVLDNKTALLILHIGEHFSRDLLTGHHPATVQLLVDGRDSNTALIALGYARSILTSFNINWAMHHNLSFTSGQTTNQSLV